MTLHRRLFLKHGSIAMVSFGAAAALPSGFIARTLSAADAANAGERKKVLVCVFQRGAADGLSMVVPHGDPFYYNTARRSHWPDPPGPPATGRRSISTATSACTPRSTPSSPLLQGRAPGDHPRLRLAQRPRAPTSTCQDLMESGVDRRQERQHRLAQPVRLLPAGRRRREDDPVPRGLDDLRRPAHAAGRRRRPGHPRPGTFGVRRPGGGRRRRRRASKGMYDSPSATSSHGTGKESFEAISMLKKADPAKYQPAKGAAYPQGRIRPALMQVAQLIKADVGMEVAFVEMDGWDTHANQGGGQRPTGRPAARLLPRHRRPLHRPGRPDGRRADPDHERVRPGRPPERQPRHRPRPRHLLLRPRRRRQRRKGPAATGPRSRPINSSRTATWPSPPTSAMSLPKYAQSI